MNIENERDAFEASIKENFQDFVDLNICKNSDGDYLNWDALVAWRMWQASAIRAEAKLEGCVVVNPESLLLHAQTIRMFNNGNWENHYEEIEEHVSAIETMVEAARGQKS